MNTTSAATRKNGSTPTRMSTNIACGGGAKGRANEVSSRCSCGGLALEEARKHRRLVDLLALSSAVIRPAEKIRSRCDRFITSGRSDEITTTAFPLRRAP